MADRSFDGILTQQINVLHLAMETSMDSEASVENPAQEQRFHSFNIRTSGAGLTSIDIGNLETEMNPQQPVINVKEENVVLRLPISFNALPPEIRSNIWKYSMRPRIVKVRVSTGGVMRTLSQNFRYATKKFSSKLPVPVVLHICQESRAEGLKVYKLCFGTRQEADKKNFTFCYTTPAHTYFSYALDTVHFVIKDLDRSVDAYHLVPLKYMTQVDKDNIRSLSTTFWEELFKLHPKLISFWKAEHLKSLEEIVLPAKLFDEKADSNPAWRFKEIPGDSEKDDCKVRNLLIEAARIRPAFCPKMWSMRFVGKGEFKKMLTAAAHY